MHEKYGSIADVVIVKFQVGRRVHLFFRQGWGMGASDKAELSRRTAEQYVQRTQELLEQIKTKNKLRFTVLKVEFVEEDNNYYLRVYCDNDREGGIGAEDLAQITRPLNKLLDKADFIPQAYTLEVCSPGYLDEYSGEDGKPGDEESSEAGDEDSSEPGDGDSSEAGADTDGSESKQPL